MKRDRKRRDRINRRRRDHSPDPTETPSPPAKASEYLHHLDELVAAGEATAAILRCRVSGSAQRAQLEDQDAGMRRRVEDELGIPVVGVFAEVAPGWDLDRQPELDAAIQAAIANGPGTVIVAESTDRYLRHPDYNGNKKSTPTVTAFEALRDRAQVVPLTTILPPDAPYEDVRFYQQNRGQNAKGNKGGRPSKPQPLEYKPNYKGGYGIDKLTWMLRLGIVEKKGIARLLGRSPSTVRGWVEWWERRWNRAWPGSKGEGGE